MNNMMIQKDVRISVCNGFVMYVMKNRWKRHGLIKQYIHYDDDEISVKTQIYNVQADEWYTQVPPILD